MNNPLKELRDESLCLLKETQEDYWRYARKGPNDFSVYTEKSSIYETPTKEKFREATDVLVRWTDGLLYLATIIQVEDEYSRCAVKFDDGSQFWALYKDIYKGLLPENEFACTVCDSSSSQPPDEIVICDKCSVGYHQLCHIPKISSADLNPDIPWSCRKCVFAAAARKGGASKKGLNAQAFLSIKEILPYNLDALSWDASHRTNLQQTYCYCGGPGEWYYKMLQCLRCKQWFHEACLQCLDEPLLFGDRFYIFVCTVCNKGPEFLRRLPLRWPDIAHLVLYNLTIIHGKKFFDFDSMIMDFLKDNWSQFQIKGESISHVFGDDNKKKLLEHLQSSKSRFTSSNRAKKRAHWGLRCRVPPPVPAITLPKSGIITNDVLDFFNASSRKSKPAPKTNRTPVQVKRVRKPSECEIIELVRQEKVIIENVEINADCEEPVKAPSEEDKSETLGETENSEEQPKKERRKLPHRRAKQPKPVAPKPHKAPSVDSRTEIEDTTSSRETLNSIIPYPDNFEGDNNPFLDSFKRFDDFRANAAFRRQQAHKSHVPSPSSYTSETTTTTSMSVDSESDSRTGIVRPRRATRKFQSLDEKSLSSGNRIQMDLSTEDKSKATEEESVVGRLLKSDREGPEKNGDALSSSVSSYFGVPDRIESGETFSVLAKRTAPCGEVQYLVEWDGNSVS